VRFIGGQALQAIGYAAILLILVRILPVADYGAYMLLSGLAEMTLLVASLGLLSAGKRYLPHLVASVSAPRLLGFVLVLTALEALALGALAALLWRHWTAAGRVMGFDAAQIEAARPAVLLFFLLPAFRFTCELLDALLEQGKSRFAAASMINGRLTGIALMLALGLRLDLATVLLLDVAVTAAALALSYGLLLRALAVSHLPGAAGTLPAREIARFIWHMAPADLMGAAGSAGAIRLALANSLGVAESGLFAFLQGLQRLAGRYLLPGTLLRSIVMPLLISRSSAAHGLPVLGNGAGLLIKANLLVVGACIVIVAIAGDGIVALLSGGKFPASGLPLLLMFVMLLASGQGVVLGMAFQVVGRTAALRGAAFIAPVALFLVWLTADRGLEAAIVVLTLAAMLSNGILAWILVRRAGVGIDLRGELCIAAAAGGAILAGLGLEAAGLPVPLAAAGGVAAFLLLLVASRPFRPQELAIVERIAGRRAARLTFGPMTKP
jgi:hypothetical protein